ncbi:hypothetical protein BBP40_009751 [Aspergillus hancockii]|nr:hypothetical protein BBP40_009751 [Aspergillus hancockii]
MSLSNLHLLPPHEQQVIQDGPALQPPSGVGINFNNPPNRNVIPNSVIPICLTLATLAILIRAYARFFLLRRIDVDDGLSLLGFGTYVAYIYCVYYTVHLVGFFVHQWNATALQFGATFYTITLFLVKAAILLQWIRIFVPRGTRGSFYWACQIVLWTNLLFYLSVLVAGNLICVPFERIWDKTVPGVCYNGRRLNMTQGAFNLFSDIFILILPQRVIWRMNLSRKRKVGIALIFAVGLIACAAAAFRLGVTVAYMADPDWLYRVSGLSMACIGEMTCIILVYCMPAIPKAFKDSTILSKISVSFRSSLRFEKYKEMGDISLHELRRPKAQHSQSTEELQISQGDFQTNTSQDWTSPMRRFTDTEQNHNRIRTPATAHLN